MSTSVEERRERRWLALAGVATGLAGVAVGQGVASALRAPAGPVGAVAAAVRDLTPGHLAIHLVHLVGHLDKPLLVGGTSLVLLLLCAWAGTFAIRRSWVPDVVFLVLAGLGMAAELRGSSPSIAGVIAVVAGFATWMAVLRFLTSPLWRAEAGADTGRRAFLTRSLVVVAGAAAVSVLGQVVSAGSRRVEAARQALKLPVKAGTQPSGASVGVRGIVPWRTPESDFYVVHTAISPPDISPKDWSLRIHGMVEQEVTVTFDELVKSTLVEDWITLCCVSNPVGGDLIGNAFWSGVPVREFLARARPKAGADAVKQTSKDGWTCGTPLAALTDPKRDAILALALNGKPLPVEHGFPVRMVVPGLYGYVSATKWVVDLEVTTMDQVNAYWTERGWSVRGPVKTQSRVDVPADGDKVKAGQLRVGGVAWAQHTGIEKVEYQLDGGSWQPAELGRVPSTDTWVQWTATVQAASGEHRLSVRATDRSGYTQTAVQTDVVPNGATGWDGVRFTAS